MKMFSSVMAETLSLEEFNSEQIIMPKRNIRLKNLLFAKSFGLASVFVILFQISNMGVLGLAQPSP